MTERARTFFWRFAHRPIPILLSAFYAFQMNRIIEWYMANPHIGFEESAGLGAVVLGGVAYFKYYVETEQGGNE